MAEKEDITSNSIFETLADFEHQLQALKTEADIIGKDEFAKPNKADVTGGPQ